MKLICIAMSLLCTSCSLITDYLSMPEEHFISEGIEFLVKEETGMHLDLSEKNPTK